jgi:CHASE2 domain-containing sensor protein
MTTPPADLMSSRFLAFGRLWRDKVVLFGYRRTILGTVGFLVLLLILCLSDSTTLNLDLFFLDRLKNLEARFFAPHPDIVIVGIDQTSLDSVPQRWPWPRSVFAELIQKIHSGKPQLIILGVVFQHPNTSDQGTGDRQLVTALTKSGKVALISILEEANTELGREIKHYQNHETFRKAALCEGFVKGLLSADGLVRSFVIRDNRLPADSCSLQLARRLKPGLDERPFQGKDASSGLIAFSSDSQSFPEISVQNVLNGSFATESFRDKIVFIGATAPILQDRHFTPTGQQSGVAIFAHTLDTLVSNRIAYQLSGRPIRFVMALMALFGVFFLNAPGFSGVLKKSAPGLIVTFIALNLFSTFSRIHLPLASFVYSWILGTLALSGLESLETLIHHQADRKEALAARRIQQEFFPKEDIRIGEFRFRCSCCSCEEVGGDYCDIVSVSESTVLFLVGDVSGHGFSAAMVTTVAKTTMELLKRQGNLTIASYLEAVNALLLQWTRKKVLMTVAAGAVNLSTKQVQYSSAGHLSALRIDQYGSLEEIPQVSYPLGVSKKLKLQTHEFTMKPGDWLVMFSDGIIEAVNWQQEVYGFERWYAHLARILPGMDSNSSIDAVLADVYAHTQGRPFSDDVTLLLIQREPEPPGISPPTETDNPPCFPTCDGHLPLQPIPKAGEKNGV